MGKAIVWTEEAMASYGVILRYLRSEWTEREAQRFIREVAHVMELLDVFPLIGRTTGSRSLREVHVSKQEVLVYRVKKDRIELLAFWDLRRDPRTRSASIRRTSKAPRG